MKKYFLFLMAAILFISCDIKRKDKIADDTGEEFEMAMKDTTTVQAIDSFYNFGKVIEGDKVEYNFRFRNTGTKSLVIVKTTASCGCTVPEKPEHPVLPGDTGFIKVVFNSTGKRYHVEKTVTVRSNAYPDFPKLVLTGEVEEKTTN
jgi:hypothetical protein